MKAYLILLVAVVMSMMFPTLALADDGSSVVTPKFFQWFPNWSAGALLLVGALFGTLFVVFTAIGGTIPGTAGQARIDADEARYDSYAEALSGLVSASPVDAGAVTAIERTVNNLRDDVRTEKWREFILGAVLYVVLGSFVALALAADWVQAIAIAAGWTSFLGTFGLKADFQHRGELKDSAINQLLSAAGPIPPALKKEVDVARAV